jgi:hypothetical protein
VATTAVSDGDMTSVVSSTTRLSFLWEGELEDGPAFVQVIIDGTDEVTDSWCSWGVAAEGGLTGHRGIAHGWWFDIEAELVQRCIRRLGGGRLDYGGIWTGEKRTEESRGGLP